MASSKKRPHLALETPDNTGSSSSSDSDQSDNEEEASNDELQVEFEARSPQEIDFHGICGMLKKSLKPSSGVDIAAVADFIIGQQNVGSVVTQSYDPDGDEDDEPNNEVFGLATVVGLIKNQVLPDQIYQYLIKATSRAEGSENFRRLVRDPSTKPALVISERFINLPPQISVPLYETLSKEINKANAKNLPFNFTHYFLISKVRTSPKEPENLIFLNAEEENFLPLCDMYLNMEDEGEPLRSISAFDGGELIEHKRLMVFKHDQLEEIVHTVKRTFPI